MVPPVVLRIPMMNDQRSSTPFTNESLDNDTFRINLIFGIRGGGWAGDIQNQ